MPYFKVLLFVLVSSLGYNINCAFVDTLHKCALKDEKCHVELFDKAMKRLAEHGAQELGIKKTDPYHIKKINGSITDVLNIIFEDATVEGVKNCVVNKWHLDLERTHATLQLTCDKITITGKYHVESTTEVLQTLIGGPVHGDGNGKVELDGLEILISFPYSIEKKGDKFYFTSELKKYKPSFKINKRVTFAADKLYLAEKESSKEIIKLINENWSVLLEAFGKHFMKLAFKEIIFPVVRNVFDEIPADTYISDDLTPYYKN